MSGVRPGTCGHTAARGIFRGLCLGGFALVVSLLVPSWAVAQNDATPPPDPMSNREFLQNGQQAAPGAGKKNPMAIPNPTEEDRRIGDLIAKRQAEKEGEFIAQVLVEGNTTIPTPAIMQKVRVSPGRKASVKSIQEDVRALWKTGWFYTVETTFRHPVDGQGQILVFKVFERPIVRSVQYLGNLEIKTKKLQEATGLKVGSPFDASANREAAKKIETLYRETEGYSEATVDLEKGGNRDDRDVVFRIHEGVKNRIIWRDFEGNHAFSSELLTLQLVSTPAYGGFVGGKFDAAKLPEDCAKVRQYYQNGGYFDAKVAPEVQYSDNRKWIKLIFHVQEGLHFKIRNISMMGNTRFPTPELLKDIKTHEGEFYNGWVINKDVLKIKKKYGELGYTYCRVEIQPRYLPEPGNVDLLVKIDEDRPYVIRQIRAHIEGDHPRTRRTVAYDYIGLAPGDPADPAKIQKSKGKLTGAKVFDVATDGTGEGVKITMSRVTGDMDHMTASLRGQSGDDNDDSWIRNSAPIGDKLIGGNLPLVPHIPPRVPAYGGGGGDDEKEDHFFDNDPYLCQPPEDTWMPESTVIRGQTGSDPFGSPANPLFAPTTQGDPYNTVLPNAPGQLDLDYYLKEARTGRLMFGVGVNSSSGLVGSIVFEEQNFDLFRPPQSWEDLVDGTAWRGAGQRFRIEAMPGTEVSRYTVSWSDPYIFHTNWNLGVSGYYFQRYYLNWTEDRVGGRINLGRQLTPEWSVTSALRLEGVRIADVTVPTPDILQQVVGDNFLSTVRGSIINDTRDMPFLPGEGHKVEVTYEQGFGQFNYPRVEADARQYFTLYQRPDGGGRQILTVGGMLGWTGDNTPIFERFFAGGFQSFRGFAFRGVSPVSDQNPNVYIGGQFMAVGTLEYQVPLLANNMVSLVTFSDFGTVEDGVTLGGFRCSVGAGFRVALPMLGPVPLAFDFGVPVVRQQTDITQVFSFYVGLNR
ncbi:MAG TPA: BamA/TamA family outer membrane protein [Planctomycetaceae bacterium]|jgi:outer membrane protein insertion porin family|nr:BamA/TamA family outer membrane protein [Planctomycetaceae bacterium]